MKISQIVLLMFGSAVLTGGAIAFGYVISNETSDGQDVANSAQNSSSGNDSSSNNPLQVLGAGDQVEPENTLPGPEDFEVYEQYADETGVAFVDVVAGDGQEVGAGDTVAVVYQGWLTDGQLFDQSRTNEQGEVEPFVFQIGAGQVIAGWEQGIAGMKVGGQRRLVIPASLGYGETGQGPIPPNSMLVFDVTLVQAQSADAPQSGL